MKFRHFCVLFMKEVNFISFLLIFYASFVLFCVPSTYCNTDDSSKLTYDQIYNETQYPQIQNRPRNIYNYKNTSKQKDTEENSYNDVEIDYDEGMEGTQLLVGFSHNPYAISVPQIQYDKGVRIIKPSYINKGDRGKRGVVHLYNMIYCATGCDPITYKGYGCYCGFLGSGKALDGIDRCCKMHDHCYEDIYCPFFTVYFQPYYWKCYHGQPLCALENHQTKNRYVNGCAAKLCECDRRFAMCLQKYRCPKRRAVCTTAPLRLLQHVFMLY